MLEQLWLLGLLEDKGLFGKRIKFLPSVGQRQFAEHNREAGRVLIGAGLKHDGQWSIVGQWTRVH